MASMTGERHRRGAAPLGSRFAWGRRFARVGSLLAMAGLGACHDAYTQPTTPSSAPDAGAEEVVVGTVAAGALADAAVAFESPGAFDKYTATAGFADVTVDVTVTGGSVGSGPSDLRLHYYLDGVEVHVADHDGDFTFASVPIGQRHLAVRLHDASATPSSAADGLAALSVRVVGPCGAEGDCDDGLLCSNETCTAGSCVYGPAFAGCCEHDLQCPNGWSCVDNGCVECQANSECGDGNICTTDACIDGLCVNAAIDGCCLSDSDGACDDGDFCTADGCDLTTNTCTHVASADPLCCNETIDCKPADPCLAYWCYKSATKGIQRCRVGPSQKGCCTEASDCDDGNLCTVDSCEFATPESEAGQCTYVDDPAKPSCCLTNTDCDDSDPSTLDTCVSNVCQYEPDEGYCALPATSPIVINEIMVSGGNLDDSLTEWIELTSTSPTPIDITGWRLETSHGEAHIVGPEYVASGGPAILTMLPGAHLVLGRSALATSNGGSKAVRYAYGDALSLPDVMETGDLDTSWTLSLYDAEGDLVDTLTFGSAWGMIPQRSLALKNPHLDNADADNWQPAGIAVNPSMNVTYGGAGGDESLIFYGSPGIQNRSAFSDISVDEVVCPVETFNPCTQLVCTLDSRCKAQQAFGCCLSDQDCSPEVFTFDNCMLSTCDLTTNTCAEAEAAVDCCNFDSQCDDSNPCNLDRCIGNSCRSSPDIIIDCCESNDDCDDGDACTLDVCDPLEAQCSPAEPIAFINGKPCCNDDAECDDADPTTLNVCADDNGCEFPADPAWCDEDLNLECDDGDDCTLDSCDLANNACIHEHNPECCLTDEECDDAYFCTADSCDVATGACINVLQGGCCTVNSECDDGDGCTTDICTGANICQHVGDTGCCSEDADCGGGYCQIFDCPGLGGTCAAEPGGLECCTDDTMCDDAKPYTLNVCDLDAEICTYPKDPNFCLSNDDCADGVVCTADVCNPDGSCSNPETPGCCYTDDDCAPDGLACTDDICNPLTGQCSYEPVQGECCETLGVNPAECDDEDPCTSDVCGEDHKCRPQEIWGCCQYDWECADELDCTTDYCDIPSPGQPGTCVNQNPNPTCCCPEGFECQPDGSCQNDLMVALPSGEAKVGCDPAKDPECASNEAPYHSALLKSFAIDKTEVTAAAYKECVEAGVCELPLVTDNYYATYGNPAKQDHPVNYVTWDMARAFCEDWREGQLCTEAQWERGARGGCELYGDCDQETPIHPWGNAEADCSKAAMLQGEAFGCGTDQTHAVGSYPAGDSPYGLSDMSGNVQEWVFNWMGPHPTQTLTNPAGPVIGEQRVYKGGSFTMEAKLQRSSSRWVYSNPTNMHDFGFRCCLRTAKLLPVSAGFSVAYLSLPGDNTSALDTLTVPADDTAEVKIHVLARDIDDAPLPGMKVVLEPTHPDTVVVTKSANLTDANGYWSATIRSSQPRINPITVLLSSKGDSPVELDDKPTINFSTCGDLVTGCPPGWTCNGSGHCQDPTSQRAYVPAGSGWMGCDPDTDYGCNTDAAGHTVDLWSYEILRYEVTASQYAACVSSGQCSVPAVCQCPESNCNLGCVFPAANTSATYGLSGREGQPVTYVTHSQAESYCSFIDMRLCTEAEWERAARGDDVVPGNTPSAGRDYPWGDAPPTCSQANLSGCGDVPTVVGSKPTGVSPYGVYDMAGNVQEWVSDWYKVDFYEFSGLTNPTGPATGTDRVVRGGAFHEAACFAPAYHRTPMAPGALYKGAGIRCCADSDWWVAHQPWLDEGPQ